MFTFQPKLYTTYLTFSETQWGKPLARMDTENWHLVLLFFFSSFHIPSFCSLIYFFRFHQSKYSLNSVCWYNQSVFTPRWMSSWFFILNVWRWAWYAFFKLREQHNKIKSMKMLWNRKKQTVAIARILLKYQSQSAEKHRNRYFF